MNYRHYSFDLWLTLIKSNPEFKIKRQEYFYKNFNFQSKSQQQVGLIFRQVDVMCNSINESTGRCIDADEMYLMVINQINDCKVDLRCTDLKSLNEEMESLLFNYLPQVYSTDTLYVLDKIRQHTGTSLNILSNTGFIKGKTIRKVLKELEIHDFFDFQIYSDEVGVSKPNKEIFEELLRIVRIANNSVGLNEVVHVGDNPIADVKGAMDFGISALLVNSNNNSISRLLN